MSLPPGSIVTEIMKWDCIGLYYRCVFTLPSGTNYKFLKRLIDDMTLESALWPVSQLPWVPQVPSSTSHAIQG